MCNQTNLIPEQNRILPSLPNLSWVHNCISIQIVEYRHRYTSSWYTYGLNEDAVSIYLYSNTS